MTTSNTASGYEAGPPTADDLRAVHFTPASMLHPGYTDREVDDFVARAADELARLTEENTQLRRHLQEVQQQLEAAAARPSPSDQAVGILATAQLTADAYVAGNPATVEDTVTRLHSAGLPMARIRTEVFAASRPSPTVDGKVTE